MVPLQTLRPCAILASLALSTVVSAQQANLLAGAPQCAQSCTVLTRALDTCQQQDSGAPIDTIAACFCTDQGATELRSNPQICASSCAASQDQTNAMTWFAALCQNPGTITAAPVAAATSAAGGNTANGAAATQTSNGAQATTSGIIDNAANAVLDDGNKGSWWDQHARWVAMAIVLIVGFTIIIIVGVCLKRRATRKRNERGGMPSSAIWGPQQSHPTVSYMSASSSDMALNRDAEKYNGGQPAIKRMQSDMSGALQPSSSQRDMERGSSRNRSRSGNNAKRLKKLVGRS